MLVFVDRAADAVLLTVDAALLGLGQMAVVLRHVSFFAVLHCGFTLFQMGGLLGVQFAVGDSVANALLLACFATIDLIDARMAGIDDPGAGTGSIGIGLSSSGTGDHQSTDCQG